ncbi:MAG: AAA family ATPase, partial [Burkholderiales bacterium]|nr:AAA family ATPase [Burkholderiales bacterium]
MITRFEVLGFKRFHQQSFDFLPLTVLTGMNGAGKSSLIQSVLLVWEASVGGSGSTVRLNDTLGMDLGTAEDVRNW